MNAFHSPTFRIRTSHTRLYLQTSKAETSAFAWKMGPPSRAVYLPKCMMLSVLSACPRSACRLLDPITGNHHAKLDRSALDRKVAVLIAWAKSALSYDHRALHLLKEKPSLLSCRSNVCIDIVARLSKHKLTLKG